MNSILYHYINLNNIFSTFLILDKNSYLRYLIIEYNNIYYYIYIPSDLLIYNNFKKKLNFLTKNKESLNLYISLIKIKLISIFFKYKLQVELTGIGYKIYYKSSFIFLSIGYSHLIKIKVLYDFKILIKDNGKLLNIFYSNNYILGNLLNIFKNLKKYNIYKGKGIKNIYSQLKLKLGKIKNIKK